MPAAGRRETTTPDARIGQRRHRGRGECWLEEGRRPPSSASCHWAGGATSATSIGSVAGWEELGFSWPPGRAVALSLVGGPAPHVTSDLEVSPHDVIPTQDPPAPGSALPPSPWARSCAPHGSRAQPALPLSLQPPPRAARAPAPCCSRHSPTPARPRALQQGELPGPAPPAPSFTISRQISTYRAQPPAPYLTASGWQGGARTAAQCHPRRKPCPGPRAKPFPARCSCWAPGTSHGCSGARMWGLGAWGAQLGTPRGDKGSEGEMQTSPPTPGWQL